MSQSTTSARYTKVAITLHWLIALSILAMIPLGFWMRKAIEDPATRDVAYAAYQFHKSLGLTILALSLARLAWRLTHKPPPLPAHMAAWEKSIARATHWVFYALMIMIPLTGWVYVSTGWSLAYDRALPVPTVWFGLFTVPHIPGLAEATDEIRREKAAAALNWHGWLAWGAMILIAGHVGAALKHNFIDKDETLEHMIPGARRNFVGPGLATIIVAASFLVVVSSLLMQKPERVEASAPETPVAASETPAPAVVAEAPPSVAPTPVAAPSPAPPTTATNEAPATWRVDKAASKIEFSGGALSGPFTGSFGSWTADIKFSPTNLAASKAVVTIQTGSAVIPDPTGTAMLKEGDWFNVAKFPAATFTTTSIKSLGANRYEAAGTLQIRDKTAPVTLPFTLTIAGDTATMSGQTSIDRLTWDIGKGTAIKEEGEDAWASGTIALLISVKATK